ncbi:MAG: hypothetical protein ABIT01_09215 [Thermoanaerobaculia bacterium]
MKELAAGPGSPGSTRTGALARAATIGLLLVLLAPEARADRRDQVAADRYNDGVALIKKGRYREGAAKIQEAVARGATEPNEEQGTETRYLARRYDPYYWLGVAQMEMGLSDQALANFEKSESIVPAGRSRAVILGWREEYADLQRRKKQLLATLEAALPPTPAPSPTKAPALVITLPTAVPTSVSVSPALPTPIPTRIALAPTAAPVPSVPAIPESAERLALRTLRAEWNSWLVDEKVGSAVRDPLGRLLRELDKKLEQRETPNGKAEARRELESARSRFQSEIAPLLRARCLSLAVEALASRQWDEVDRFGARARTADPRAAQPDLLLCVANATRYILEGRRDSLRLEEARKFLRAWKSKVPTGTPTPRFLSPAVREVLL